MNNENLTIVRQIFNIVSCLYLNEISRSMKIVAAITFSLCALAMLVTSCNSEDPCPDRKLVSYIECPKDTSYVCGCNDVTYLNECEANRQGVRVEYQGRCIE